VQRRAYDPNNLSGPSSGQHRCSLEGQASYHEISSSLEGWTPPRANLRLARGLDAPSGESPPRSRPSQARDPSAHSPDQSIKCSGTTRALGSKANPRHTGPPTPPGNHIPALIHQPFPYGHPWHCRRAVHEDQCQLHGTMPPTPVRPARHTPRKGTAEPSKGVRKPTPRPRGTTP
jgi:hypothetical protein